jgi:hypothetical protein
MSGLNDFIARIKSLECRKQIDDVLELLPYFERLDLSEWKALLDTDNGEPCTTSLYQSGQVKMKLIYWKGRQASSVHGHPGGGGLIKVLAGRLEETRYAPVAPDDVIDTCRLEPGSVGFIHDLFAWHQVSNPSDTPAVSLHLYSLVAPALAV